MEWNDIRVMGLEKGMVIDSESYPGVGGCVSMVTRDLYWYDVFP